LLPHVAGWLYAYQSRFNDLLRQGWCWQTSQISIKADDSPDDSPAYIEKRAALSNAATQPSSTEYIEAILATGPKPPKKTACTPPQAASLLAPRSNRQAGGVCRVFLVHFLSVSGRHTNLSRHTGMFMVGEETTSALSYHLNTHINWLHLELLQKTSVNTSRLCCVLSLQVAFDSASYCTCTRSSARQADKRSTALPCKECLLCNITFGYIPAI
jgi:hypothetical protein